MRKMKWSSTVPGTDVNRIDLLTKLIEIRDDETSAFTPYRNRYVRELDATGVLSANQIAHLVGCAPSTVKNVLGHTPKGFRGELPGGALDLMLLVATKLRDGHGGDDEFIARLVERVPPILLAKFVGYSQPTYWRVAKEKRDHA